jgi:2-aminoadipate transaminase
MVPQTTGPSQSPAARLQVVVDRHSRQPLHAQIEAQFKARIESGAMPVGSRLPPSRVLARTLGVNRATVTAAYDALAAAGLVAPCVGRGTEVVRRHFLAASDPAPVEPLAGGQIDWEHLFAEVLLDGPVGPERSASPPERIAGRLDFASLVPDESLFPVDALRRALDVVLRREGEKLLQYGSPAGWEPFRELLAERLQDAGMTVGPGDILVVNGAQQGLDLICRALLDPGDAVAVEAPTYANLLPVLRLHRAEIFGVPMTGAGLDLDRLEAILRVRRVKFLYTMPHFQNPTGITTSLAHRQRLLDITGRHGVIVIEDGFEEDLGWDGSETPALRALDASGRVCYLGTFSKGLVPGFRIGWLVAERSLRAKLVHLKRTTDYHTSLVLQAALAEFCRRGDYDAHLRRLRRAYRARMTAASAAFATHMPPGVRWRVPRGGFCLWVELPAGVSVDELLARLARDGVYVTPGRHFFAGEPEYGCFRMSISRTSVEEIAAGIAILGRHLYELVEAAPGTARLELPYV